jgi:hypothetical protein
MHKSILPYSHVNPYVVLKDCMLNYSKLVFFIFKINKNSSYYACYVLGITEPSTNYLFNPLNN